MKTPAHKTELEFKDREAELMARWLALQERDRELTAEIINLEKRGDGWDDQEALDLDEEAFALLLGDAVSRRAPIETTRDLKMVRRERQIVRRAIELCGQLLEKEAHEKQLSRLVARMDEWRKLIRQTAIAVLQLQQLNRARLEFKRSIGGQPSMPCDVAPRALLGTGEIVGPEPYSFIQSVLAAGIMTKGEIDRFTTEKGAGNG
jgi:hypothetical protein